MDFRTIRVYFRRPLVVNRYHTYDTDVRPAGFRVVEMQGAATDQVVEYCHFLKDRNVVTVLR